MSSKIGIIISREYLERVSKKSFIITTLLVPIIMLALMALPTVLMVFHENDTYNYAVIDNSGKIAPYLDSSETLHFTDTNVPLDSAKADENFDGILVIGSDILENPSNVAIYNHDAGSIDVESTITSKIKNAIETERLKAYNIENLSQILDEVNADVQIATYRISKDTGEEEVSTSSMANFMMGLAVSFILYMFLIIYGQMVMTSIIEEKNNRVLEIVVSSIKPEQLMMGKILGIGLVAITQIAIWAVLIMVSVGAIIPALLPAETLADVSAMNAGQTISTGSDIETIQTISTLTNFGQVGMILTYMVIFLIGGFLLYSSIYAAIGSAVDNIQDASQLQSIAIMPIVIGFVCATVVGMEPNSTLAVVLSMIPFTSPMLMMVRIPYGIPTWEPIVSIILLFLTFILMVWIAAKIYRVGIFMYGKKPTIKELIRWARYK